MFHNLHVSNDVLCSDIGIANYIFKWRINSYVPMIMHGYMHNQVDHKKERGI